jgi:hypothetical protein
MILCNSEEYGPLSEELARGEEHATINTPLLWAKLQEAVAAR